MMYKHKNSKQLLCCVLLLCLFCGSSLGFFSVNADTVIQTNRRVGRYYDISGTDVRAYYAVDSLAPFTEVQSIDYEYVERVSDAHNLSVKGVGQYYIFSLGLFNNTDNVCKLSSWYCTLTANTPALTSSYKIGYTIEHLSENIGSIDINTDGTIWVYPSGEFFDDGKIVIPPHSSIMMNFVVCKHISRYDGTALNDNTDSFDTPVSDINYLGPNTATFDNSIPVKDIYYNSSVAVDELARIETQLINIYSQLNNQIQQDNSQLISNQEQTNSNITAQTEQQKEQYDAFSASTDSSDSSNINSAITGGTDAVKEKMGLFSFFDGIVTDLSDVLTKNHERHLVLPALDVPLPEETVHIWDRKEFDFEELENNFGAILTVVRFATVAVCYVTMINGAYHLFHKFIGVKDSDA